MFNRTIFSNYQIDLSDEFLLQNSSRDLDISQIQFTTSNLFLGAYVNSTKHLIEFHNLNTSGKSGAHFNLTGSEINAGTKFFAINDMGLYGIKPANSSIVSMYSISSKKLTHKIDLAESSLSSSAYVTYDQKFGQVIFYKNNQAYIYPKNFFAIKDRSKTYYVKTLSGVDTSAACKGVASFANYLYICNISGTQTFLDIYDLLTGIYRCSYYVQERGLGSKRPNVQALSINSSGHLKMAVKRIDYTHACNIFTAKKAGTISNFVVPYTTNLKFSSTTAGKKTAKDNVGSSGAVNSGTTTATGGMVALAPSMSMYVFSAIAGNFWAETGINPGIWGHLQTGSNFFGLGMWGYERKDKLLAYLKSNGYNQNSGVGQASFLMQEKSWASWNAKKYGYTEFMTFDSFINSTSTNLDRLTMAWLECWECAHGQATTKRKNSAKKVYDYVSQHATDESITDWIVKPNVYLTDSQTLNNAVMLYRVLVAGTGGPGNGIYGESVGFDFNLTTKKLSSSDNFEYLTLEKISNEETPTSSTGKTVAAEFKSAIESLKSAFEVPPVIPHTSEKIISSQQSLSKQPPKPSTFGSNVSGSILPIASTYVEAPHIEVTIGGVTLGSVNSGYRYPNYIQSLSVEKTNGTINSYTLTISHQITPGNNPNYIANLLSNTGFNTINIKYGDSNSNSYFFDEDAFITDVKTSFNFSSCNINYIVSATSLSYLKTAGNTNYAAIEDKPSNQIIKLLADKTSGISEYFEIGDISTTDSIQKIDATKNQNILDRLAYLVSLMKNTNKELADKSSYYLVFSKGLNGKSTVNVKEINTMSLSTTSKIYEVNVGYPDDNYIFDFSISSNYAWTIAYNESTSVETYSYDIDNAGRLSQIKSNAFLSSAETQSSKTLKNNWWKQVTRFPITATLTSKELLAPIPLLTYIKINNYYFGRERISSGLYIITSQTDSISGSGCRTTLGLTRVASNTETITIDGRVVT